MTNPQQTPLEGLKEIYFFGSAGPRTPHAGEEEETDEERDARFGPVNDRLWGPGNWIRCATCNHDSLDREVYHHRNAHL